MKNHDNRNRKNTYTNPCCWPKPLFAENHGDPFSPLRSTLAYSDHSKTCLISASNPRWENHSEKQIINTNHRNVSMQPYKHTFLSKLITENRACIGSNLTGSEEVPNSASLLLSPLSAPAT